MAYVKSTTPRGAHLVGSVPLADARSVFAMSSELLGNHLHRIPDGETGERSNWIGWQAQVFARTPALELLGENLTPPQFKLRPGYNGADVRFGELGYSRAAIDSFVEFTNLEAKGDIPERCRFQVSLPTPLAPIQFYIAQPDRASVEPAYEHAMLVELQQILDAIPHDKLAVQWDTAVEFGVLEGIFPAFFGDPEAAILHRLVKLANFVPPDVEVGFHLCYGDAGHQHFVEPQDTTWLVKVANALAAGATRSLDWLHLPVPGGRDDADYFKPLADLHLHSGTELYLGLLHNSDGMEGAQRRIEAARAVVEDFGVATECGFGRRPAATIPDLMKLHADAASSLT